MDNIKKMILITICLICAIIGVIWYAFRRADESEFFETLEINDMISNVVNEEVIYDEIESSTKEEIKKIVIHMTGEVVNQGIVEILEGERIDDAIKVAGGTTPKADLSKVNLAYVLEDGQKVYIPSTSDKEVAEYINNDSGKNIVEGGTSSNQSTTKKEEKLMININTANQEELERLPGVGDSTALKIIEYRKSNGKFNSIEDIKNVSGIGEAKFSKIKDNITVK